MTTSKARLDRLERRSRQARTVTGVTPPQPENIIGFATGSEYLGVELFPAQATFLKVATLSLELMTPHDLEVIERWTQGFRLVTDQGRPRYEGTEGTPPDLLERMQWCRDHDMPWFREIALVLGRRGSKGLLSAILVAWRIYRLLQEPDLQQRYGLQAGKALVVQVYGANLDAAKRDIFGDIKNLITVAPCFEPFLARITNGTVGLNTPAALRRGARPTDPGLIRVTASPTTSTAGRGLAAPAVVLDEFAHLEQPGTSADSTAISRAVRPAIAQFDDGLLILASSPWNKSGELYATYRRGLEVDAVTQKATNPTLLVVQLPSWSLYLDWERAHELPMWPGGPMFAPKSRAIIDEATARARIALDPEGGAVEYLSQFAADVYAYLPGDVVRRIFEPWNGRLLRTVERGALGQRYVAHADPSKVGANYAFAVAHLEYDGGTPHVVFDAFDLWRPGDFPDHCVDYSLVQEEILSYLQRFSITDLTFDQYSSVQTIQNLRAAVRTLQFAVTPRIYERTATARHNWLAAETFKMMAMLGLIHAPPFEQAHDELEHLQVKAQRVSAPTIGRVTTDDVADSMIGCVYSLVGENHNDLFTQLAETLVHGSQPGGLPLGTPATAIDPIHAALSATTRYLGHRHIPGPALPRNSRRR